MYVQGKSDDKSKYHKLFINIFQQIFICKFPEKPVKPAVAYLLFPGKRKIDWPSPSFVQSYGDVTRDRSARLLVFPSPTRIVAPSSCPSAPFGSEQSARIIFLENDCARATEGSQSRRILERTTFKEIEVSSRASIHARDRSGSSRSRNTNKVTE